MPAQRARPCSACPMCRAAPRNPLACVLHVHPTVSTVVMVSFGACSDLTLLEAVRPELLLCRDFVAAANKSHVTLKTLKLVTRLKNHHVVTCHNSVTRLWVMTPPPTCYALYRVAVALHHIQLLLLGQLLLPYIYNCISITFIFS